MVTHISREVMKEACKVSLQTELQKLAGLDRSEIVYQSLSKEQTYKLAHKINFLPLEYRNFIFFRYYFENTAFEIDKILEKENTENKLLYVQRMLSRLMELNNTWIDNSSMKKACELALQEDMKFYDNMEVMFKPQYSIFFRRKLKKIKTAQNPYEMFQLIVKRVAVFVAVCILSFSVVVAVNAEAREKFYRWIVETFPKFSIFITQNKDENNGLVELNAFKIKYIPKNFELINTTELRTMLVYNYSSKNGQRLTIQLSNSDNGDKTYYDTENTKVEEFSFKESVAYIWQTNQMIYFIWYQDGIECYISGNLDKDEMIKIAESMEK